MNIQETLANALSFHQNGNISEAEALYKQVLQQDYNNDIAWQFLGILYNQQGFLDEAANCLINAAKLNPSPELFKDIARIHTDKNLKDEAIGFYLQALQLDNADLELYKELAELYYEKNQISEAIQCYRNITILTPEDTEAYCSLGNLYHNCGNQEESMNNYIKALKLNADLADSIIFNDVAIRYKLWRYNREKFRIYNTPNSSDIKFSLIYFYEEAFDESAYQKFLKTLSNQTYKNYDVFVAENKPEKLAEFANELESQSYSHICFIEQGDIIDKYALTAVAQTIDNNPELEIIYSDEDIIDENEEHVQPYFKPEYSPLLLLSHNYMNAFLCLKLNENILENLKTTKEINQKFLYKLVLNHTDNFAKTHRIADVLYSRSLKNQKKLENTFTKDIIEEVTKSRNYNASIQDYHLSEINVLKFHPVENSKISIIIPFKDKADVLKVCIDSIESKSTYQNYEIILVNNRSKEAATFEYLKNIQHKVINADFDFNFSKVNNIAVKKATGEYFIFLNNDTEVIAPDWMESMLGLAQRPEIGVVGSKLLYSSNIIQHVGMVKMVSNGVHKLEHINRFVNATHEGYKHYNNLIKEYIAHTGACIMISKEKFYEIGGFNEDMIVECSDVDICLKALKAGYYNVYNPHSVLYHHESVTRLASNTSEVLSADHQYFSELWKEFLLKDDPFFNPNFSSERKLFNVRVNNREPLR